MDITVRKREINNFKVKIVHLVVYTHDETLCMYPNAKVKEIIIMIAELALLQSALYDRSV